MRRATDEVLGREVAVKILHPHLSFDEVLVDRFRREAVAAARLTHPSIVAIYDTVTEEGLNAIVMEMVHGMTLRQFLDQRGPLEPHDAVDIAAGVAEALAVAHEAGIVHRDVKPANILLCDDRRVKVADFGIAKAGIGADLTNTGTMIGTAKYLAPEQVEGTPVDPRTDLYSLGVVLYECLTGKVPFEADSEAATALARLHRDPLRPRQVRPSVPRSLDAVTMSALARDPDQRPPTAEAFRAGLLGAEPDDATAISTDHTIVAPLAAAAAEPDSFTRSERRWLVPTALIVVIGMALALAGILIGRTDTGQQIFDRARELVTSPADGSSEVADLIRAEAIAFDPIGGDGEHDDITALAIDGDPSTTWHTEFYDVSTWENKAGVGLIVVLDQPATIHEVEVTSPTSSWAAEIYVSGEADHPNLDGWGEPVGTRASVPAGAERFELTATEGRAVLVWLTDLGEAGPTDLRTHIADVTVRGT